MKSILLITLLILSNQVFGQYNSENINLNHNKNGLNVISSSQNGLTIEINIGNYEKTKINIDGQDYFAVNLPEEGVTKVKGNPELPIIARSISIQNASDIRADLISSEYSDFDVPIIPSKGPLPTTIKPDEVPYSFSTVYKKNEFYPKNIIKIGKPYLIRDVKGIALKIFPFAYNPVTKKLRVYSKLEISVTFIGQNLKNPFNGKLNMKNKYFEPLFKNHFINYNAKSSLKSGQAIEEGGRMLIIAYDDFYSAMQPFVIHKENIMGIPTQIVKMSDVGTDTNDVYNYIKNNYETDNSLTFVLLVGDRSRIPTTTVKGLWLDYGGSDPSYSLVSGNDNYPDLIIGRFSATTEDQVNTMVSRTINYETMSDQSWFHKGIGIGGDIIPVL